MIVERVWNLTPTGSDTVDEPLSIKGGYVSSSACRYYQFCIDLEFSRDILGFIPRNLFWNYSF